MAHKSGVKFWKIVIFFFIALAICLGFFSYSLYHVIYHKPLTIPVTKPSVSETPAENLSQNSNKDNIENKTENNVASRAPCNGIGYIFNVPAGTQVSKMADTLAKDGVMDYPSLFVLWVKLTNVRGKLKAGEYLIKPGTTPKQLIDLLISGKGIQYSLTLVEGWNFENVMKAIHQDPKLTHTLTGLSPEEIMTKIGHPGEHPEGQFFPDTYCFPAGMSDVAFLQRAYNRLQQKLSQAWTSREGNFLLKSPYEALILASIIEKESDHRDEYGEISGVYHRRIQRNMPLQADPTVIYGAGKLYNGKLTIDLLKTPSPYNTYLIVGLPPTPIAIPSEKALIAATHPKAGDSLYFVAKGEGKGHVFSRSYDDHQVAVSQYRIAKNKKQLLQLPLEDDGKQLQDSEKQTESNEKQSENKEKQLENNGKQLLNSQSEITSESMTDIRSIQIELKYLPVLGITHLTPYVHKGVEG